MNEEQCPHVWTHILEWDHNLDGSPIIDDMMGDEVTPGYSHCLLPAGHDYPHHQDEEGNEWDAGGDYWFAVPQPDGGVYVEPERWNK